MPTPNNPFEEIILPTDLPSAWPPAPIYWVLAVLLITVIVGALYFVNRYLKQQKVVKQALATLHNLQQKNCSFAEINQLLKGFTLAYYPRAQVASLNAKAWFDFLQQHYAQPTLIFSDLEVFNQRLYQQSSMATEQDFMQAKRWLKGFSKQFSAQQKGETNA